MAQPPKWYATPPRAPAKEAVLAMIHAIPDSTPIGLRDRAMFRLMLDGALRVDALCGLDIYDAKNPPQNCIYPNGRVAYRNKGGRTKETVVDDTTLAWVERWLAVRGRFTRMWTGAALFLSERGHRMQRATLHARIKAAGAASGMPHLHAHLLRHCRARDLIGAGPGHRDRARPRANRRGHVRRTHGGSAARPHAARAPGRADSLMLVITRKRGQKTTIGEWVLRVDGFTVRGADFAVLNGAGTVLRTVSVPMDRAFYLAAGVYIVPKERHGENLKLGIQAPAEIEIRRDDIKKPKPEMAHG